MLMLNLCNLKCLRKYIFSIYFINSKETRIILPQYTNVMFYNRSNSLIDIRRLSEFFASREILQSGCDHLNLTARVGNEYRRQSARSSRDRVHGVSAHAVGQIHELVYRTYLSLMKLAVSRVHERPDGLIVDFVLGAKRQNRVIDKAGDVHGRSADYGQSATGAGVLQHQIAVGTKLHLSQYCQYPYLSRDER